MRLEDYQEATGLTAIYQESIKDILQPLYDLDHNEQSLKALRYVEKILNISYVLLGYGGEVGEIMNKFKKVIRGDKPLGDKFISEISGEIGGSYWYGVGRLPEELGLQSSGIAYQNIIELTDRKQRGVIQGDGDNR